MEIAGRIGDSHDSTILQGPVQMQLKFQPNFTQPRSPDQQAAAALDQNNQLEKEGGIGERDACLGWRRRASSASHFVGRRCSAFDEGEWARSSLGCYPPRGGGRGAEAERGQP